MSIIESTSLQVALKNCILYQITAVAHNTVCVQLVSRYPAGYIKYFAEIAYVFPQNLKTEETLENCIV